MTQIRRIYVEKKPGADGEVRALLQDIRDNLGLHRLADLRIAYRYDVEGLSDEAFETACRLVFCDNAVDTLYHETLSAETQRQEREQHGKQRDQEQEHIIEVEWLPGQIDQKADSAAQCIQLLTLGERPPVRSAIVYILRGPLTAADREAFIKYVVNPLDARLVSAGKPASLSTEMPAPPDIAILDGFCRLDEAGLVALHRKYALSMSVADLDFCRDYFSGEGRDPSMTELRIIDTYWSDHCRHTTFNTVIESYAIEEGPYQKVFERAIAGYQTLRKQAGGEDRPISLMDMATVNARAMRKAGKLDDLDVSEEVNASSIKVTADTDRGPEPWLVMFKNETHNHPTEMEPYGGAATCIGGGIRDPLSGRAFVYQAMRVTGCADPLEPVADTLPGKLPQRTITRQAAAGYSGYANAIGVTASLADEIYHPGYKAKRMEIGAVVAAAPEAHVRRETPVEGDLVLLIGGRTGRDGIGAAASSSKAHDERSTEAFGTEVQKGDALLERGLLRLYRNPAFAALVKRCNDFGAGGVSVAVGELAPSLDIDLDQVPVKYDGLDGTELAISESQERMAVVIGAADVDTVLELAAAENLEAAVIARVAGHGRMKMSWRGREIVDLSRDFLDSSGVARATGLRIAQPAAKSYFTEEGRRLRETVPAFEDAWKDSMGELNHCSKEGLVRRFDSTINAGSILLPLGGARRETPAQAMAAKLPVTTGDTRTCTWMSYGFDPDLSQWSPFHGALYAVTDALTKLACAGGDPFRARMSFQEYFPSLGEDPEKWGRPMAALLGAQTALTAFGVPAIGGKDSMSGSFGDLEVPPTLCAFALSVGDLNEALSPEWKKAGSLLVYFPAPVDENLLPDIERIRDSFRFITDHRKSVHAAYAVGSCGLAAAIAVAAFGNNLGAELTLPFSENEMFAPAYGSVLLEVDTGFETETILEAGGLILGHVTDRPAIRIQFTDERQRLDTATGAALSAEAGTSPHSAEAGTSPHSAATGTASHIAAAASAAGGKTVAMDLDALRSRWKATLEPVFPSKPPTSSTPLPEAAPLYTTRNTARPTVKIARPSVVIPIFPGTHGEYDAAAAFRKAGASVDMVTFRNLTSAEVKISIKAMASSIAKAQILMLPGGFSGIGDPIGEGKLIAAAFRNPALREQVELLLYQREGLILGIGSGFQALVKLGLIPYGDIRDLAEGDLALTANTIGYHQSAIVQTQVTSVKSPWFAEMTPGEIRHVPVSHAQGRIKAELAALEQLAKNGQVAARYVGDDGKPSMDIRDNPFSSAYAIESLTSPDGRILGKMGHDERSGAGLYQNVPGHYDQKLFVGGVSYFK